MYSETEVSIVYEFKFKLQNYLTNYIYIYIIILIDYNFLIILFKVIYYRNIHVL